MPRIARAAPGGFIYHVFNRSVAKFKMLRTEKDKQAFLACIIAASQRFQEMRILGWCIMENHWHFVLWPRDDGDLSTFMHWLTLAHASRWRTSHETIGWGPLYQGRFKSLMVQDDSHFLTVLRYVERNPVRANLVKRAEEWKWGSLHVRAQRDHPLGILLHEPPVSLPAGWINHVNSPQTVAEEQALSESIRRSRPFGDDRWQRRIAGLYGLEGSLRKPGRPPHST